jgi:ribosomal 50S subunit-recycling heat shock protein
MLAFSVILASLALGGRDSDKKIGATDGVGIRVNKYLADKYSRRETDRLVASRRVTINGKVAKPGDTVHASDFIKLDGRRVPLPRTLLRWASNPGGSSAAAAGSTGGDIDRAAASASHQRAPHLSSPTGLVYIVYNKVGQNELKADVAVSHLWQNMTLF